MSETLSNLVHYIFNELELDTANVKNWTNVTLKMIKSDEYIEDWYERT